MARGSRGGTRRGRGRGRIQLRGKDGRFASSRPSSAPHEQGGRLGRPQGPPSSTGVPDLSVASPGTPGDASGQSAASAVTSIDSPPVHPSMLSKVMSAVASVFGPIQEDQFNTPEDTPHQAHMPTLRHGLPSREDECAEDPSETFVFRPRRNDKGTPDFTPFPPPFASSGTIPSGLPPQHHLYSSVPDVSVCPLTNTDCVLFFDRHW